MKIIYDVRINQQIVNKYEIVDTGKDIISCDFDMLPNFFEYCLSFFGGVLKLLIIGKNARSEEIRKAILKADGVKIYKLRKTKKIVIMLISNGRELSFRIVIPKLFVYDPDGLLDKINSQSIKFYQSTNFTGGVNKLIHYINTLPIREEGQPINIGYKNNNDKYVNFNFMDNGEDIIAIDSEFDSTNDLTQLARELYPFMSFVGGILKIFTQSEYNYDYGIYQWGKSNSLDILKCNNVKILKSLTAKIPTIRVLIPTVVGDEKEIVIIYSLNRLYDPEDNIHRLDECQVKFCSRNGYARRVIPATIATEEYQYKNGSGEFYFTDNGEDITSTNFDEIRPQDYLASYYGGVMKVVIPNEVKTRDDVLKAIAVNIVVKMTNNTTMTIILTTKAGDETILPLFADYVYDEEKKKSKTHNLYALKRLEFESERTDRIKFYICTEKKIILIKELQFQYQ